DGTRKVRAVYALRKLFSIVWGDALSPRNCTRTSPFRPTTVTDTRWPWAWHVCDAVVAMVNAVASDRSLRASRSALAGVASARQKATARARRISHEDMSVPPWGRAWAILTGRHQSF